MAAARFGVVASALLLGQAAGQVYLGAGGSVSYNGGGLDWATGTQTLDSVGGTAAPTPIGGNNCGTGATIQQSPIDIVFSDSVFTPVTNNAIADSTLPASLNFVYPPVSDYKVEMNEHTLEVKFNLVNAMTATNYGFTSPANGYLPATQLHFHSPSEHTVNGVHYPLELHIVNQKVTGVDPVAKKVNATVPASVIAIVFKYTPDNQDNAWLAPLLSATPNNLLFSQFVTAAAANQYAAKNNSVENLPSVPLDLGQLVNQADPTAFFTYPGTLTTPGCNQVVTFYLLNEAIPVSYRQVVAFTNLLAAAQGGISRGADNRPPNPILPSTKVRMNSGMYAAIYPPTQTQTVPCAPTTIPNLSGAVAAAPRTLFVMAASALVALLALAF